MDLLAPLPTVGVDLGRRTIKVAAVRQGNPPRLLQAASYPTPEGAIDGGTIRNASALATGLRIALRNAGIRRGRAVVGMGGRTALVRTVMLPPMPEEELKNAVKWEAERHLPLRIDEAVLDAQVVREVTDDGRRQVEVLMAAVPESDALRYYQIAHDAGLDVAALEVSALALARTLANPDTLTAAVDIGADATEIVIAHRALAPVCRSLPIGGDQLVPNAASSRPETDPPTATTGWQDLLDGVARSIDYFQAQARREKIERVVVTGDGVRFPGIVQMLATELSIPVAVGDPLSRVTVAPETAARVRDYGASLAVAIGLALRTLR